MPNARPYSEIDEIDEIIVQALFGPAGVTSREVSIAFRAGPAGILGRSRMTDSLIFDAGSSAAAGGATAGG
jgi:hypothetical protein